MIQPPLSTFKPRSLEYGKVKFVVSLICGPDRCWIIPIGSKICPPAFNIREDGLEPVKSGSKGGFHISIKWVQYAKLLFHI